MKKTVVTVLVVIALVLALAVAGALGFLWYRDNHVFVDGDAYAIDLETLDLTGEDISFAYYEELQAKLPDCAIIWNVPFQNGKLPSNTASVTLTSLEEADIPILLTYLPALKTVEAGECENYAALELLKAQLPEVQVHYDVSLGAMDAAPDVTELVLETGFYDYDTLMENLLYLPHVQTLRLKTPDISLEQVDALRAAYPEIDISCTVELLGQEYDNTVTELDLSAMTSADLADFADKLAMLPNLSRVNLNGTSLSKEEVAQLMTGCPGIVFAYSFDFYGTTVSTADEEVVIKNVNIGDENEADVRATLDILTNCKRFVLDNCKLSNEVMAKIREDYRDRTKVVWRVSYGKGHTLTDAVVIRAVYDLVDDNCHNLIYCEDAKYMDIGHNEWLDACEFVSGMKSLEYVIISGAPIKSLEPFRNCKNLKLLEAAFCEYITDVSPLADCGNLQMLNISNTHVMDLSPLDDLPLTHLTVRTNPSGKCRLSQEEQDRIIAQHPDCWISFAGAQPYGVGWRYGEDELAPLEHYQVIRTVFRLAQDPNIPNHVGWYLKEEEQTAVDALEEIMDAALAQRKAANPAETQQEETIPAETQQAETLPAETTEATQPATT